MEEDNNLLKKQRAELRVEIILLISFLVIAVISTIVERRLSIISNSSETWISILKLLSCCAFISVGLAALVLIMNLSIYFRGKRTVQRNIEYDKITQEINSNQKKEYLNSDLILTPNYIVIASNLYKVIRYSDVLWIYTYEYEDYKIIKKGIGIHTNDNKYHWIVSSLSQNDEINSIYKEILAKVPQAMVGKTKENKIKYKQIIKDLKNK